MPDLADIGSYATFDERRGTLTLNYKQGSRSTIETVQVDDLDGAGALIQARGWRLTAERWDYSVLEGHTIGITREGN